MVLFRLFDDENYDKICGQILFTTKGRLAYYCTLCGQYRNHESFIAHILEECIENLDDDLKASITKASLTGLERNKSTKRHPVLYDKPVLEQKKLSENRSSASEVEQSGNKNLVQKTSTNKVETSPVLPHKSNSSLEEIDPTEKIKLNDNFIFETEHTEDEIDPSEETASNVHIAIESEHSQVECNEGSFEEYTNFECLEDEDDENVQISYQTEKMVEIDECSQDSYLLEQDHELETNEESCYSDELETNESFESVDDEGEQFDASLNNKGILNKSGEITKSTKFTENQEDIPFVVRDVRTVKRYHPSHITPEERKFKCPICGFGFKDNHNMNLHWRRHTNLKAYSCPDCNKKFYTSTEARLHSKIHKTPVKPFLCTECGLTFETNYRLVSHQKRHTNQKDYVCEICKKGFYAYGQLKTHMSSHSSERPYACNECAASFKLRGGLRTHIKAKHK